MDEQNNTLPTYQCHKQVRAAKISAIEFAAIGSAKVAFEDHSLGIYETGTDYHSRFRGSEADLGYLVVYEDGYESWSPTEPFEAGYSAERSAMNDVRRAAITLRCPHAFEYIMASMGDTHEMRVRMDETLKGLAGLNGKNTA